MKPASILIITFALLLSLSAYFIYTLNTSATNSEQDLATSVSEICVPTFRDGGGPYYLPNSPFRKKIVPDKNNGEKVTVKGKVLLNDCKTLVKNAVIDIWQANETGNYQDEWYRGQINSDSDGNYEFESVVPKGYGEGTGYRPPHIHFKVFVNGAEMVTSQMFFPEVKGTAGFNDAYIMKLETGEEWGQRVHLGIHNIILP
jgi:protocatechuate 3,4-dioxygenase beta subunit